MASTTATTTTAIKAGDKVHQSLPGQLAFNWHGLVKSVTGDKAMVIWDEMAFLGELEYEISNLTAYELAS